MHRVCAHSIPVHAETLDFNARAPAPIHPPIRERVQACSKSQNWTVSTTCACTRVGTHMLQPIQGILHMPAPALLHTNAGRTRARTPRTSSLPAPEAAPQLLLPWRACPTAFPLLHLMPLHSLQARARPLLVAAWRPPCCACWLTCPLRAPSAPFCCAGPRLSPFSNPKQ